MVDTVANSAEDYLIDSLKFKIEPGASYVTNRQTVSYVAAGGNMYTSNSGANVTRINITGDAWMDPSTVRSSYALANTDSTPHK